MGCNTVFDTNGNVWDPNGAVPADPRDVIINGNNGAILATVHGVGAGDEVWFNPGTGNYYATGSGSPERPLSGNGSTPAGVVDAASAYCRSGSRPTRWRPSQRRQQNTRRTRRAPRIQSQPTQITIWPSCHFRRITRC